MEQLEEELTCPICCGLFEDPRVLLCSHSFCRKCLEGLRAAAPRAPLRCPTCRKESPHKGAGSLQINYSLRGIVDKYSRIRALPRMSECARHRGQPLNMFCATDSALICGFCATAEEHSGHRFCSAEEAYAQEKEAFEELLRGVESWRGADMESRLETLQAAKKAALQAVTADARKVTDYLDKLLGALESKKSELLSDLETEKLVLMQHFDPDISRLRAALDQQRAALRAADALRSITEPLSFLQHMHDFRQKIKVLRDTPPPRRRPADAAPLARDLDVNKWDSLRLGDVDRISMPHGSGPRAVVGNPARVVRVTGFVVLTLAMLLVLQPAELPAWVPAWVPTSVQPLRAAVSWQLARTGAQLSGVCTRLVDAAWGCVASIIEATDRKLIE